MNPERKRKIRPLKTLLTRLISLSMLLSTLAFPGCGMMMSSATSGMMEHLSQTILNSDDPELVEAGAPAYLLMIDSLISKDPENQKTLSTAALLYSAYADIFVTDPERSRKIARKSLGYGLRAMCLAQPDACGLKKMPYETFEKQISRMGKEQLPELFTLGTAWAGWILANKNDFNAVADMARIELIMQKVTQLDPTYRDGTAYLYLGTMATLLPPALGGKPEQGKKYFETAIRIGQGKNLMAKVSYARMYARMIFDRELHDRLLKQVLAADPDVPGYTLINTFARQQAEQLLAGADDYF